jgi:hypothetical protein
MQTRTNSLLSARRQNQIFNGICNWRFVNAHKLDQNVVRVNGCHIDAVTSKVEDKIKYKFPEESERII